jgi:tRNA-binding protein
MATFDDFQKLDIRVGEIIEAKFFERARNPAYKLIVDFGKEIGIKNSSAQITEFSAKKYSRFSIGSIDIGCICGGWGSINPT